MIVTDQKWAPAFIEWLDERCPGYALVQGQIFTVAHVDAQPGEVASKEQVLAVAGFSRLTPHSCEATVASNGEKRKKASREFIWSCFHMAFEVLGKSRLYTFVAVDNEKSIAIQHMLGLTLEARLRDHFGTDKDAFLFGITKRDWQAGEWSTKESPAVSPAVNMAGDTTDGRQPLHHPTDAASGTAADVR